MTTLRKRRGQCTIHVDEMTVELEAARNFVAKLKGILEVRANHISHMLWIEYDPDQISTEEIRRAIHDPHC